MATRPSSRAVAPALVFQSLEFHPVTRKGQVWLRAGELAQALGYVDASSVNRIYARRADEFTPCMTGSVKLTDPQGVQQDTRVFSLRGAHLVAMFARTPVAKDFRRWVLDVLDHEVEQSPAPAPVADTLLPEAQAKEIEVRLNRLGWLFHPTSQQFQDVNGILRTLRGLDPRFANEVPSYRQLLKRVDDAAILKSRGSNRHSPQRIQR